jgi:hypothetical protein
MTDIASEQVLYRITIGQSPAEVLAALDIRIGFVPTWQTVKAALDMRHQEAVQDIAARGDGRQLRLAWSA